MVRIMIISKDSKPRDTVYYISACVLELLVKKDYGVDTLFDQVKNIYNSELEYSTFLSALNFLFLIGKIDLNEEGLLVCI